MRKPAAREKGAVRPVRRTHAECTAEFKSHLDVVIVSERGAPEPYRRRNDDVRIVEHTIAALGTSRAFQVDFVTNAVDATDGQQHASVAHANALIVFTAACVDQKAAGIGRPGRNRLDRLRKTRFDREAIHVFIDADAIFVGCSWHGCVGEQQRSQQKALASMHKTLMIIVLR